MAPETSTLSSSTFARLACILAAPSADERMGALGQDETLKPTKIHSRQDLRHRTATPAATASDIAHPPIGQHGVGHAPHPLHGLIKLYEW